MNYDTLNYKTLQDNRSENVELLLGLASMFYLFRRFDKSLAVIAVADHISPQNRAVLELKIVLQCELKMFKEVLNTIEQLGRQVDNPAQEIEAIKRRAAKALVVNRTRASHQR